MLELLVLFLFAELPQTWWLQTMHIYYPIPSVNQESTHILAESSAKELRIVAKVLASAAVLSVAQQGTDLLWAAELSCLWF